MRARYATGTPQEMAKIYNDDLSILILRDARRCGAHLAADATPVPHARDDWRGRLVVSRLMPTRPDIV